MKKIFISFAIIVFVFFSFSFAESILNMGEFLTIYLEWVSENIPNSWRYIDVKYNNVRKWSELYKSLQKWIYLDIFPNIDGILPKDEYINQEKITKLLEIKQKKKFKYKYWEKISIGRTKYMIGQNKKIYIDDDELNISQEIFEDVKKKLEENYIYPENIDKKQMWYGAIKWYIDAINDEYTVFFQPTEAKNFDDSIEWNFEWIWAYIEMTSPWNIIITAPIKDSPAERWWIKAGDIIIKVWDNRIEKTTNTNELINRIKWPKWTYINILIKRWWTEILFKIKREKIDLPNIEYELLSGNNCYISINEFNRQSRIQFRDAINYFTNNKCEKYIFDVRNNPGWVLDDVWYILNYFVPQWESIVNIKYKNDNISMFASNSVKKLTNESMIVMMNGGSASASEIFAGVIKDYVPNSILLWTKTFWKWSVQNLIEYVDWSMLKYTIAKWYTGKSNKNIDLEWINPDIKMEDDLNTKRDEVLEVAKIYKFK